MFGMTNKTDINTRIEWDAHHRNPRWRGAPLFQKKSELFLVDSDKTQ